MTNFFPNVSSMALIVGLAVPFAAEAGASETSDRMHSINIRVYNYAGVSAGVLAKAQKEAARVFLRSGIETNWIGCAVPGREPETKPTCKARPTAMDILVRILPRKMAQGLMKHHSEFGLAFTASGDGFGSNASIFYHRVEELSAGQHTSEALLLGHLVAHEMGHLLLGVNSHSRSGIMHVPWKRSEIERASLGTLFFTKQETKKMCDQVSRRMSSLGMVQPWHLTGAVWSGEGAHNGC